MGKNYFTPEQQEKLKNNKFTESCSQKSIKFTLEFKELFIVLYTEGVSAKEIFVKCAYDAEVLGASRIGNFASRMKHFNTRDEKFDDLRKFNSGRYKKDPETAEEEIVMLKHKIALLTQELELLKKNTITGYEGNIFTVQERYILARSTLANDKNDLSVTKVCEILKVSRTGYYNWLTRQDCDSSAKKEEQDKKDFELILLAYNYRGYDKGSRGIHMRLLRVGIVMNRKKIQRLMRQFGLKCPIRNPNPYKQMAKAVEEGSVFKNVLARRFRKNGPRTVILTDITYLFMVLND